MNSGILSTEVRGNWPHNQPHCQELVHRSFDQIFAGNSPGELFTFNLADAPVVPTSVRFEGRFENLASDATGVRFALSWWIALEERRLGQSTQVLITDADITAWLPGDSLCDQTIPVAADAGFRSAP